MIAGAVLLLIGFGYWALPFLDKVPGGENDISVQMKRVAKYRQAVKERGLLEAKITSLNKSLQRAEAGLLTGQTAALAAVDIQNVLNEIALASGVEIRSVQILKSQKQDADPYVGIPVQFTVYATIRQLKDILYRIETSPKFLLTVERIGISVFGASAPGQIRCDITVSGIMNPVKE